MTHLILGGTGTVGSAVVAGLLAAGESVKVLTRSDVKATSLPEGARGVVGDLAEPATYGAVFKDYDTLFLLNALSTAELQEGLAAVNEARRTGAGRIVYLSVFQADRAPHIPHFATKLVVERAIEASGIPYAFLRADHFFQNDYWVQESVTDYGVYPEPLGGVGLSRVDVRDIADAAVRALTDGSESRAVPLVGPDVLTGADCARAYADALGREVRYGGDDLDAWSRHAATIFPDWMAYDLRLMYALFQEHGLAATADDVAACEDALGHPPRAYADFVAETAASWQ